MLKKLFLVLFFTLSFHAGDATTYYFSSNGNDNWDGKRMTSAWNSLKKISEGLYLFKAGDSLLFERGSVFTGQINISISGLYLGAYGTGRNPVISGSVELNGWVDLGKNIWRAECSDCSTPANLFINNTPQSLGRYPNNGYLVLSGVSQSGTSLSGSSLPFKDGYWNGAEIVVKSGRWTIDNLPVKEYRHQTFTTSVAASYPLQAGAGYFIQKHAATLDQPGEWFYQVSTKQIYLALKPGVNPADQKIEVSVFDFGLRVNNAQDLNIENLTFARQGLAGIIVSNSDNISLKHVEVLNSGKNGMEVTNCKNPCVANSLIAGSANNGMEWHNNTGGKFLHNAIRRTGIHPGRGCNGDGTYIALRITADKPRKGNNLFQFNTIDSTGYIGIDFRTGNTIINNNRISNFCLLKDDGGGIYTWNNTLGNNTIENNIIYNGIGAGEGTHDPMQLFTSGIYIDDRSSDISIKNNDISDCSTAGIFLHNAKAIRIVGNRLFNNGNSISSKEKGQLYIRLDTLGQFAGHYNLQLDFLMNEMTAGDASYCIYLSADKKQHLLDIGRLELNQFNAARDRQAVAALFRNEGFCSAPEEFSLTKWQRKYGYEKGSVFRQLFPRSFKIISKNLISNGSMTVGAEGWMVWPEEISVTRKNAMNMDDPVLQVNFPAGSTEGLLYHEGFSLSKGALYRLSFTAGSRQDARLEFVPLMAHAPWQALGQYACFSIGPEQKTFIYYFSPNKDNARARVNFKSTTTFWIDNVSLYEVIQAGVEGVGQN